MVRCLDLVKHVKKTQRRINSEVGNEVGRNITYKQDLYNNCGPCGGEVGRVDEKEKICRQERIRERRRGYMPQKMGSA